MTDKDYGRWLNFATIVAGKTYEPNDLLQELLLKFIEKKVPQSKYTDSFIFTSLKNLFLDKYRASKRKKRTRIDVDVELAVDLIDEDLDQVMEKYKIEENQIEALSNVILSLPIYDKKLYQLHFIWGLSQREIAKQIGVSHMTINGRINKIKEKIKEQYGKEE